MKPLIRRFWRAFRLRLAVRLFWLGNWAFETGHKIEPPYEGPICPDCQAPEPDCYCDTKGDQQRIYSDIAADAFNEGFEAARRDMYR